MNPKIYCILLLLFSLAVNVANSQDKKVLVKEKFNFNKAKEDSVGYAQAVKVGNTIYISGSTGSGTMPEAIKMAYDKLEKTLSNYNLTFENVVKENLYTTSLDSLIKYKNLRKAYYKSDYPAATWIGINHLSSPKKVLEVELVAVLPE
jgi:2-iminobutanoate/2-iminopropanoate deaminase